MAGVKSGDDLTPGKVIVAKRYNLIAVEENAGRPMGRPLFVPFERA